VDIDGKADTLNFEEFRSFLKEFKQNLSFSD